MSLSFRTFIKRWGAIYVISAIVVFLSFRLNLPKHGPMSMALLLFLLIDLFWYYRLQQSKAFDSHRKAAPWLSLLARLPLLSLNVFCGANLIQNLAFWSPFWRTYGFGIMLCMVGVVCITGLILILERLLLSLARHSPPESRLQYRLHQLASIVFHSSWIVGTLFILAMLVGSVRTSFRLETRYYAIALNAPAQHHFRIAQFSDLHIGSQVNHRFINHMVDSILSLQPDAIVFTGDLINFTPEELYPFMGSLKRLQAPHGVFMIDGNHDYGTYLHPIDGVGPEQRKAHLDSLVSLLGWQHLENEACPIRIGEDSIYIVGIGYWGRQSRSQTYSDASKALRDIPAQAPIIVLTHNPQYFEDSVSVYHQQVDICLSGHTHGAQMGLRAKHFRISPLDLQHRYWGGMYQVGSQHLIVNTGTGFNALPFRIGLRPEISCIDITF